MKNESRIVLGVPLTHSDWMHRSNVAWGPEGVRYMLEQCKASGWTRVYWRLFNGGRTVYQSAFADPQAKWDDDSYWNPADPADYPHTYWYNNPKVDRAQVYEFVSRLDYTDFDTLEAAVKIGHELGLEIHAWLSVNEDDHGWGMQSRFTKDHPESRWVKRDGTRYRSQQSFAFAEVREYKLALIREVLERYEVDGFFLDWIRTGDVRDDPQNDAEGVADYGYEAPLVTSFQAEYGISPYEIPNGDDRWVRWRARPRTEFMRSVRRLMKELKPELPLAVMGQHPWSYRGERHGIDGNLRGLLLDTAAWAWEGLMDEIVAAGYYLNGGDAGNAYRWLQEETGGAVKVWMYAWVPDTLAEFERDWALARELGVGRILFWEADYIDAKGERKSGLQERMRAAAGL